MVHSTVNVHVLMTYYRIENIIELAKEGIKQDITHYKGSLEKTADQFELIFEKKTKDSPFYFPFKDMHKKLDKTHLSEAVQNEAINVIGK